jgi:hypoxanthine phosphoribosyltransferase
MKENGTGRIIISEAELQKKVSDLGKQISNDYIDKYPVIVSVLKGAFYFVADLTRCMSIPVNIDFLAIGVYPGLTNQTGIVRITKDLDISITGRHVIMVEDIIGTGLTLGYLYQHLESFKPESISICTLIDKPNIRLVNIPVAYCGFTVPDVFLVGYGLDHKEDYRHLPYIAELVNP